ncbi:hypothetical protein BGX23_001140 [Mortierella sp. AD031]|nr:hypothetical protein BGX23_001140 [Mortierella sp. AD031]KAG0209418.1 hypothetical protein BGX33_005529 [Mortierella sp. NVP41]
MDNHQQHHNHDQQQHLKNQSAAPTDPRIAALASSPIDPLTLVLLDPATPPSQSAAAAGVSLSTSSNIATTTARPSLSFAGSGFFAATQDPSRHLAQLPLETPYFTPQAPWTESRSDYFSTAASTPAPMPTHFTSPLSAANRSQANLFANSFSVPAQTPAAVDISSFSASSPSYFPSPTDPSSTALDQDGQAGFQLSMPSSSHHRPGSMGSSSGPWEPYPSTRSSSMSSVGGLSSMSIPPHKPNMSISMPLSSLMSPPSSTSSPSRPTMSALSQSHHSPVAPAAPAELNLKEMTGETVSQLLEQVLMTSGGNKHAVMLLDMRPSVSHAAASIQTAVSVCVSNMLLRRPMYSLQMVTEQLTTEQDIETFSKWKQFSNIVLFDAAGAVPVVGSPTILMVQKFRKEGCNATLAYLNGGFNEFVTRHNTLCRIDGKPASTGSTAAGPVPPNMSLSSSGPFSAPASTNPMSIVSPPRQRLHLGSLPSMMTQAAAGPLGCQTPMIENPNVNPLFESVRQAMGLSTNITEEIPVRLPMGFSFDTMKEHLPKWLLSAITDGSGKVRLAEYFQKVEINENKRLALLMLPQNMRSGRTTNFSIGAGIEQGLKNRYNNIWPYDHTRVKLTEIDPGHDDYINASFLTPPLSRKSYIATQGPLPSTFQDFWKTAWEQNSRVVVMLTREQEMGRIKCHQYWPSAQHPLMEVGSMLVSFVNEFLPDPTIGTILVRQLKLQHIRRPEEPARSITQIQYTGWPDFGVPETPLEVLRVIQLSNEHNVPASAGPMIVHCSAGCGRTGAFCVIDSILTELHEHPEVVLQQSGAVAAAGKRLSLSTKPSLEFSRSGNDRVVNAMASSKSPVSGSSGAASGISGGGSGGSGAAAAADDPMADIVFASVSTFREQRISMVQTLRQYVFCYEAIYWHLALEFAKERPDLGLMVTPPPSLAVHTPLLPMPPNTTMMSNPALSMGNAPITTTSEEFSFFG